jgi:hypothetical protein
MVSGVGCCLSRACIMPILSKNEEQQQQAKDGYWLNELDSLGIEPKRKTELDDAEELENLAIL